MEIFVNQWHICVLCLADISAHKCSFIWPHCFRLHSSPHLYFSEEGNRHETERNPAWGGERPRLKFTPYPTKIFGFPIRPKFSIWPKFSRPAKKIPDRPKFSRLTKTSPPHQCFSKWTKFSPPNQPKFSFLFSLSVWCTCAQVSWFCSSDYGLGVPPNLTLLSAKTVFVSVFVFVFLTVFLSGAPVPRWVGFAHPITSLLTLLSAKVGLQPNLH